MSIFGHSDRFVPDAARSPGPIYHSVHGNLERSPKKKGGVLFKQDYAAPTATLEEPVGHRDSWIKGQFSPSISVHDHGVHVAPNLYEANYEVVKAKFPSVSFPKSERFLSQKVCMTDKQHQRELITSDSPGPKYNVEQPPYRSTAPKFTFSKGQVNAIRVGSPVKSHRESWLSVINRKGLFVLPPAIQTTDIDSARSAPPAVHDENHNQHYEPRPHSSNFGTAPRFGLRENPRKDQATTGMSRVQYISARHARENMGEFSPGPIYTPHKPAPSGGRLAPAPRAPSPPKHDEVRGPDTNLSSRSCWLSGNIRKNSGREIMLMRTGDNAPGPGAYYHPTSSFGSASFSHNAKVKRKDMVPPRQISTSPPLRNIRTTISAAMLTVLEAGGSMLMAGSALGEVLCINYMEHATSTEEASPVADLLECTEWTCNVALAAITCLHAHGAEVVVGDADGNIVLLSLETGAELRRYQMEGAVVAAVWHHDVFVVIDHVGNIQGIDKFSARWKRRLDVGMLALRVHSIASVQLLDGENQLCSYVVLSLDNREVLFTHMGHVVARLAAPTVMTSLRATSDQRPRIYCGGVDSTLYELVGSGSGASFRLEFQAVAKVCMI
ncbi:hypothetical protein ACHHYP_13617 [Achlya hypogyna]|uniref:Uncharacterized protein n=1 Tax=Achlya hypogyna TaxID=1202772 RepID=A0A1V9ZFZ5_ACHHY|nr:hypothetical protein ACHHYP_13617 [Achlya hypogyna]